MVCMLGFGSFLYQWSDGLTILIWMTPAHWPAIHPLEEVVLIYCEIEFGYVGPRQDYNYVFYSYTILTCKV
jgi:hypothetical protein